MSIVTIDLHGFSCDEACYKLENGLNNAVKYGEQVIRIIHGQGKHSETFPVIKSMVRHWLRESDFAREYIQSVFRGEDGSPFTMPNPGETLVVLKISAPKIIEAQLEIDEEEEREKRKNIKKIRAD